MEKTVIELTDEQQAELSEALIAADDVLNVLLQNGIHDLKGMPPSAIGEAWKKVRGCAWLYEHQWYAERGISVSVDDLKARKSEMDE